jgi:hypothetical protein
MISRTRSPSRIQITLIGHARTDAPRQPIATGRDLRKPSTQPIGGLRHLSTATTIPTIDPPPTSRTLRTSVTAGEREPQLGELNGTAVLRAAGRPNRNSATAKPYVRGYRQFGSPVHAWSATGPHLVHKRSDRTSAAQPHHESLQVTAAPGTHNPVMPATPRRTERFRRDPKTTTSDLHHCRSEAI